MSAESTGQIQDWLTDEGSRRSLTAIQAMTMGFFSKAVKLASFAGDIFEYDSLPKLEDNLNLGLIYSLQRECQRELHDFMLELDSISNREERDVLRDYAWQIDCQLPEWERDLNEYLWAESVGANLYTVRNGHSNWVVDPTVDMEVSYLMTEATRNLGSEQLIWWFDDDNKVKYEWYQWK